MTLSANRFQNSWLYLTFEAAPSPRCFFEHPHSTCGHPYDTLRSISSGMSNPITLSVLRLRNWRVHYTFEPPPSFPSALNTPIAFSASWLRRASNLNCCLFRYFPSVKLRCLPLEWNYNIFCIKICFRFFLVVSQDFGYTCIQTNFPPQACGYLCCCFFRRSNSFSWFASSSCRASTFELGNNVEFFFFSIFFPHKPSGCMSSVRIKE